MKKNQTHKFPKFWQKQAKTRIELPAINMLRILSLEKPPSVLGIVKSGPI
jgi:hypothetical protein